MDRESKRLTKTRTAALLGTVLVHGVMILWALSVNTFLPIAIPSHTIQLLAIDKPPRLHQGEKLSALPMNWVMVPPSAHCNLTSVAMRSATSSGAFSAKIVR